MKVDRMLWITAMQWVAGVISTKQAARGLNVSKLQVGIEVSAILRLAYKEKLFSFNFVTESTKEKKDEKR